MNRRQHKSMCAAHVGNTIKHFHYAEKSILSRSKWESQNVNEKPPSMSPRHRVCAPSHILARAKCCKIKRKRLASGWKSQQIFFSKSNSCWETVKINRHSKQLKTIIYIAFRETSFTQLCLNGEIFGNERKNPFKSCSIASAIKSRKIEFGI